jgi:soluble lytic murein transglycosylase-like protein
MEDRLDMQRETRGRWRYLMAALAVLSAGAVTSAPAAVAQQAGGADSAYTAPRSAAYAERYDISRELAQTILDVATAEGIDPELAFRLVYAESRFHPRARGPAGALGLLQLMPSTARALDRSLRTEDQILHPTTNLRLGFGYLRRLIRMFDGNVRLGLLAYNRGEGTVSRALRRGEDPENGYSHKVLGPRGGTRYKGTGLLPER